MTNDRTKSFGETAKSLARNPLGIQTGEPNFSVENAGLPFGETRRRVTMPYMVRVPAGRAPPAPLALFACMFLVLTAFTLFARDPAYRSVSVDGSGQLHIVLDSGKEILPRKTQGQVSFDAALISADSRTIGWLVMYPFPAPPGSDYRGGPIAGGLAIYRGGRIIHTFTTQQVFWDWQFQHGGKQVAYSTGPAHGGAAECVLRDVEAGRIVAHWRVTSDTEPPSWARNLRQ